MTKDWNIEIAYWQRGGTNFNSLLFTLIQKADPRNKARLRAAFPEEVAAFEAWEQDDIHQSGESDKMLENGLKSGLRVDNGKLT